jgi:hypothetical protein
MNQVFKVVDADHLEATLNSAAYKKNGAIRAYAVIVTWLAAHRDKSKITILQKNIKKELDKFMYLPKIKSGAYMTPVIQKSQLHIYSKNLTMYDD